MTYSEAKKWANVGQKVKVGDTTYEITKIVSDFERSIAERTKDGNLSTDYFVDIQILEKA